MRVVITSLLAVLCLSTLAFANTTINLSQALKNKTVKMDVVIPKSFGKVTTTITNLSDSPITIIPLGTSITPSDDEFQRLGLAFSDSNIVIKPRTSWTGEINTVCRDQLLEEPKGKIAYGFNQATVSTTELKVLEYWSAHPYLPQLEVNKVIWGTNTFENLKILSQVFEPRNSNSGADVADPAQAELPVNNRVRQAAILDDE